MKSGAVVVVLVLVLFGLGCGAEEKAPQGWKVVSSQDLTPAQGRMKDRAEAARNALFSQLGGRLKDAMKSSGPAAAISICASDAPLVASEVSEQHDLAIGRTSFRLRNPENEAPDWAKPLVAERVEEAAYLEGPAGELGVMLPIRLSGLCVRCHGTDEEIPAEVREALARKYPEDEATGFAPGDLRGWFWVEVAPESQGP